MPGPQAADRRLVSDLSSQVNKRAPRLARRAMHIDCMEEEKQLATAFPLALARGQSPHRHETRATRWRLISGSSRLQV